jgi:hypothetical protein
MSSEFVRYTPEIETIDPQIDELLAQIIAFWEKKGRESPTTEGTGRAVRGAHAKSFGLVKAEVEILAGVPAAYAQGIYAQPGRHGALMRFSSTSGHLGTDALLGPGLGLAIKMFEVDGPKLVDDEPDSRTFDLVLKNNPIFISNTAKHYLFIEDIGNNAQDYLARGKAGLHELLTDVLTGRASCSSRTGPGTSCSRSSNWRPRRRCAIRCSRRSGPWARCVTVTTSPRFASLRPRRAPSR